MKHRHLFKKKTKQKIIAGTVAAATSAAILVGSSISANDDFLSQKNKHNDENSIVMIEAVKDEPIQQSLFTRIAHVLPDIIKYVLGVPLWLIAHLVLKLIKSLLLKLLSPLLSFLLYWILLCIVLLLIIVICVKIMFPDMKVEDILTKKMVIGVMSGSFLIEITDHIGAKNWQAFADYRYLFQFAGGLIIITIALIPYIRKYIKIKKEPQILFQV